MRYLLRYPHFFGYNDETAVDNEFQQHDSTLNSVSIREKVQLEFQQVLEVLKTKEIDVVLMDAESPTTESPDAIFPNNWFSTHENGLFISYPMKTLNRQTEINADFIKSLGYNRHHELENHSKEGIYLEGTGSMVFDRKNRILYASRSERTNEFLIERVAKELDYDIFLFDSFSPSGKAIYHTNVVMHSTENYLCIGLELLPEKDQRRICEHAEKYKKRVITLSPDQTLNHFAGNMLELRNQKDRRYLALSNSAFKCLKKNQIKELEADGTELLPFDIPTIEKIGGGSIRCMIAELV